MAENDTSQEKTEEATPKRLREAREKGQIPRSRELTTLVMLLVSAGAFLLMGGYMAEGLLQATAMAFQPTRTQVMDTGYMLLMLEQAAAVAFLKIAPFLALTVVAAIAAPVLLGGWAFSPSAIAFKWEKLDPLKGLKRVFGPQGLMELVKGLSKFSIVLVTAIIVLWNLADQFLGLTNEPVERGILHAASLIIWAFFAVSGALVVVALVDVPFQLWNHAKQLRMSLQEVKDEMKDTEGKPEVKGRVRELQREMARQRMMAEIPKADVVVTNPTHYAVALRYDQKKMGAPVVVAKGVDLVAAQIRRVADEARVPQLRSPALARAIYYSTELNDEIPAGLYKAVAQVLAYIYQLRRRPRYSSAPLTMTDVHIPDEYRRDNQD